MSSLATQLTRLFTAEGRMGSASNGVCISDVAVMLNIIEVVARSAALSPVPPT